MSFLTNFRQIFASLTPADNSLTLFMTEIMVVRYVVLEKQKYIDKFNIKFQNHFIVNRNVHTF